MEVCVSQMLLNLNKAFKVIHELKCAQLNLIEHKLPKTGVNEPT